jgi:hypothetical protein
MKDFSEVQEFIDGVNKFEIYVWFKENFLPLYETQLANKTMWVDYSSLIKGLSYDIAKSTLFVTFVSDKSYAYYNVPVDVFVCGAFTDYLNEMDRVGQLDEKFNRDSLSMGGWFNEMVKGYFDYTLIN